MARLSSADLLAYTQEYVHTVFSDLLKKEGFISPDGKDTIWYRVVNKEVVNTICFNTRWLSEPIILYLGYGIHPLFVEPFQTSKVYLYDCPSNFEMLYNQSLVCKEGPCGGSPFSPSVPIMVPCGQDKGLYTLEGIALPKMNSVKTALDCYKLHKSRYQEGRPGDIRSSISFEQRLRACSTDFVDEGIFADDTECYPFFRNLITERLQNVKSYDEKMLRNKDVKKRLIHLEYQKAALFEGNRSEFLGSLDRRKRNVIDVMEKKLKITI